MKYHVPTIIAALAAGTGVFSLAVALKERDFSAMDIALDSSVINSAAYEVFHNPDTRVLNLPAVAKRQEAEPDPNRNVTTPDNIFVVQCLDAGFRGDCLVFGAGPGDCVSYFDFQSGNDTSISDKYNNAVSSLSTNTGGVCQFYKFLGCNNKGDDRGLTSSYNYNLAVPLPEDPRTVEYENEITSWRC